MARDAFWEETVAEAALSDSALIMREGQQEIALLSRPHGLAPIQRDPILPLGVLQTLENRQ